MNEEIDLDKLLMIGLVLKCLAINEEKRSGRIASTKDEKMSCNCNNHNRNDIEL